MSCGKFLGWDIDRVLRSARVPRVQAKTAWVGHSRVNSVLPVILQELSKSADSESTIHRVGYGRDGKARSLVRGTSTVEGG